MRKIIFTLVLAIVSSVWMTNEAGNWCMPSVRTSTETVIKVAGIFQVDGAPCEPNGVCPNCLTIVFATSDKTYYLVTDDGQLIEYLDTIQLGTKATVTGIPFTRGSYDYIQVSHIEKDRTSQLPSLCDEWNIAKISNVGGPIETIHTVKAVLGADTIIEAQHYVKLIEDSKYKGAMREGASGVIYYIPAGSAHEYLLYNFNAKVGDRLTNLWYGGDPERCPNGYNATVLNISNETPRVFTIEVEYIISDSDGEHIEPWLIYWTEGVGLSDGPAGQFCPGPDCACSCGQVVLCAYKNGKQVYVSEMGEQYGCVYNYDPYAPTDTIPLFSYTGDDPGSSTVDPVDPNQVVVTLNGDELTIREYTGVDITYSLQHDSPSQIPSLHRAPQSDTFRDMITLQITESGEYMLQLTNPSWGYSIYGTFFYSPQGIEQISSSSQGGKTSQLVLTNGQIYILRGEKIYTLQGQETK